MHAAVLRYFLVVARSGSIRKASELLYIAPSALTRQIVKLEEEIGTELFDRLPNGMRLNAAGDRLLLHVEKTLREFNAVRNEIHSLKGDRGGHIKLAAVDSAFMGLLPATVVEFSNVFPSVTYTMLAVTSDQVVNEVLSGHVDVGITFVGRLPLGVSAVCLVDLCPGVVMVAGHPLAERSALSLVDCSAYPLLTWDVQAPLLNTVPTRDSRFESAQEMSRPWNDFKPSVACNFTPLIKHLILADKGISFLSKIAFMDELLSGAVVWRPFESPELNRLQLGIVVPTNRSLSPMTQNFVSHIDRQLRQMETLGMSV